MNKIKFFKTKKMGFSLVELLIVVAIITISSGIVLKSFDSSQKTETELEIEGLKLSAIIASQKNDALSGKNTVAVDCAGKYTITVDADKKGYTVTGCNPMSSYKLKSGVTFSEEKNVTFNVPLAKVLHSNGTEFASGEKADFVLIKGGKSYMVSVSDSGNITQTAN